MSKLFTSQRASGNPVFGPQNYVAATLPRNMGYARFLLRAMGYAGAYTVPDDVLGAADFAARAAGTNVVWFHDFSNAAEVTNHLQGHTDPSGGLPPRRILDESGSYCVEQMFLGGRLAAPYTAGDTTLTLVDATNWPTASGSYHVVICDSQPDVDNKNELIFTGRTGNTLTGISFVPRGESAFRGEHGSLANAPWSYAAGAIVGNEVLGEWRRTFSALPAGENGKTVDDPAASGAVPLRSKLDGNAYSVPRDASIWQYGFYTHDSVKATWNANWTPWVGGTTYTPRGTSQGSGAKYGIVDGNEFWYAVDVKIDSRLFTHNTGGLYGDYRHKCFAIQSEISGEGQLVHGIGPSYNTTYPENYFGLLTLKAARVIGVDDHTRTHLSYQPNSPWDIAPWNADWSNSSAPHSGLATPDGALAWRFRGGEWLSFLYRIKPGRSGFNETEITVKVARSEDPAYDGTWTTILDVTDAKIIYSGHADDDYPDGAFSYPTVPVMDSLPGYQAAGVMGLMNIGLTADIPPPEAAYYVRMRRPIFSKAAIPPPLSTATAALPSWVPSPGQVAVLTNTNGGLTNHFRDVIDTTKFEPFYSCSIVNDYSGSVLNPYFGTYGARIFEGDGHAGGSDNSVVNLELGASSMTFRRVTTPATVNMGSGGTLLPYNTAVPVSSDWGEYTTDTSGLVQPASRHSWGAQEVVGPADGGAAYGTFYRVLDQSLAYSGFPGGYAPHKLDFTATTGLMVYQRAGSLGTSMVGLAAIPWTVFVPAQGRIYAWTNGGNPPPQWYTISTGTYTVGTGTTFSHPSGVSYADGGIPIHIPERDLVLMLTQDASANLMIRTMAVAVGDTNPSWDNTARTLSTSIPVGSPWSCACWCPGNQRIIVGDINGDPLCVYEIQIPTVLTNTWTATRVALPTAITWAPSTCYKKWSWNPKTLCIEFFPYAARSGDDTVFVYRPRNT